MGGYAHGTVRAGLHGVVRAETPHGMVMGGSDVSRRGGRAADGGYGDASSSRCRERPESLHTVRGSDLTCGLPSVEAQ